MDLIEALCLWCSGVVTGFAIILIILIIKSRKKHKCLPKDKKDSLNRFSIVECSNKDDYKFKEPRPEPPLPPPPLHKKYNSFSELKTCFCYEVGIIKEDCQNRMPNGKCTSFVCTKKVRFK